MTRSMAQAKKAAGNLVSWSWPFSTVSLKNAINALLPSCVCVCVSVRVSEQACVCVWYVSVCVCVCGGAGLECVNKLTQPLHTRARRRRRTHAHTHTPRRTHRLAGRRSHTTHNTHNRRTQLTTVQAAMSEHKLVYKITYLSPYFSHTT